MAKSRRPGLTIGGVAKEFAFGVLGRIVGGSERTVLMPLSMSIQPEAAACSFILAIVQYDKLDIGIALIEELESLLKKSLSPALQILVSPFNMSHLGSIMCNSISRECFRWRTVFRL